MLHGMTVAAASSHTSYLLERETEKELRELWVHHKAGEQSFPEFKAEMTANSKSASAEAARVKPLKPGEEQDRLAFAAQFVTINNPKD